MLDVLHLSRNDGFWGSGRAALRLHRALLDQGVGSRMFVERMDEVTDGVEYFLPTGTGRLAARARSFAARIGAKMRPRHEEDLFGDDRAAWRPTAKALGLAADVVHLHLVSDYLDIPTLLPGLLRRGPVVWTLHDMNLFTGGCHFDLGCGRFTDACGRCPQLRSTRPRDRSHRILARRTRFFGRIKGAALHLVAPSKWLAEEVKRSPLTGRFPVSVIPNGLDVTRFAPVDKAVARAALRIPSAARVLLFVAGAVNIPRKGLPLLLDAVARLKDEPDLFLLSAGHGQVRVEGLPSLHMGSVQNDRLLALVYSAADIFVIPSLADNLPNTILEALACGVPVVGFDTGGIPDLVRDQETGVTVTRGDAAALAGALRELLRDDVRLAALARSSREMAKRELAAEIQAGRYLELYERLLVERDGGTK